MLRNQTGCPPAALVPTTAAHVLGCYSMQGIWSPAWLCPGTKARLLRFPRLEPHGRRQFASRPSTRMSSRTPRGHRRSTTAKSRATKLTKRLAYCWFVCLVAALPVTAQAADTLLLAQSPERLSPVATDEAMLVTAVGVLVGATSGYLVLPFRGATLLGAFAGGSIANWWYDYQRKQYLILRDSVR